VAEIITTIPLRSRWTTGSKKTFPQLFALSRVVHALTGGGEWAESHA